MYLSSEKQIVLQISAYLYFKLLNVKRLERMSSVKYIWLLLIITSSGCIMMKNPSGNAYKTYELGEYSRAANLFKKSVSAEKNKYTKGELSFYLGECYRITNKPSKAASAYSKSLRSTYQNPLAELYMAQMLLMSGKPDKAAESFTHYLEKNPHNTLAINGLTSAKLIENMKPNRLMEVKKVKELNSKYSDYSPVYGSKTGDIIYFSSMRYAGKRKGQNKITGQGNSHIYFTQLDTKNKWSSATLMDEPINTQFDEGALSMSSDNKTLYFTRCLFDKTKELGSEIFMVSRSGGRWGDPEQIILGGDSIVYAHPAISADNLTLYFVSDMPGGKGGKDIWKVERADQNGKWGLPINLGAPINTPGDEMFPTCRDNGSLYFSSNGHAGYGGLDIYQAEFRENQSTLIKNMGAPINSTADDFGIVFLPGKEDGLFCSSRENLKGVDNIFSFNTRIIRYGLSGKILDEKTHKPIENAYVRMVGSDGTNDKIQIEDDGVFSIKLKNNTDYVYLVAAPGYLNQKQKFTTQNLNDDTDFLFDIYLMSSERPIVFDDLTFNKKSFAIDPEMVPSLERIFTILSENPQLKIQIVTHTDGEGDETQNVVLSQKQSQAILDYLIKKGIATERLSAKGVGGSEPVVADKELIRKYRFLFQDEAITEELIESLRLKDQEIARQINRRTEFKVIK